MLTFSVIATTVAALVSTTVDSAHMTHMSKQFMGAKANRGTVTHRMDGAKHMLTLSDDFKIPDTPAPHWQIVDSAGNVYLLKRLKIKDDQVNRTIEVPAYIHDVAKVQIWCSWAEALLGETSFDQVIDTGMTMGEPMKPMPAKG